MKKIILIGIILEIILIPILYYKIYGNNCMSIYVKEYIKNNNTTGFLYENHIDTYYTTELIQTGISKGCSMYSGDIISDFINTWGCYTLYYYFKLQNSKE